MGLQKLERLPLARISVRALVKCEDKYLFIKRTKFGDTKSFLICPGGRVEFEDRVVVPGKSSFEPTLRHAMERQLKWDLAADGIRLGEFIGVSKMRHHAIEALFAAEIDSYDFDKRSGIDTLDPNLGDFELVTYRNIDRDVLSRRGLKLEPKEFRKLIPKYIVSKV